MCDSESGNDLIRCPELSRLQFVLSSSNLDTDDPTKTVFAIIVSILFKKWSCIVGLFTCAPVSAKKLFDTIISCIRNVEHCGLFVEIISTDNYPLNVKLFKLFSPNHKLETRLPNPCDIYRTIQNEKRPPALKSDASDFVGILLSLLKISNVNIPFPHTRLNEPLFKLVTFNDDCYILLTRVVYLLEAWQSLPEKGDKLSKQTFTSFKHACLVLPQIANFLT
ncbi:hypothetical protein LOD99_12398 [Oopsacas minuta]|uniref:Transposable element P transposase-like RNase H domain-containing protein n=1 Tax=Oopsacas minuta TaxID=111878 RepID=A0AAV7JF20_9METZ|nr:hypothetical protein LOD99_12398 [Oopsacas minuta]